MGKGWGVAGVYPLRCWLEDFKPQVEAKQLMKFSFKEGKATEKSRNERNPEEKIETTAHQTK